MWEVGDGGRVGGCERPELSDEEEAEEEEEGDPNNEAKTFPTRG